MLNGYISSGSAEPLIRNGIRYTVHRYQGEHKNEFLLQTRNGDSFLFENNVLKQQWKENEKGMKLNEFIAYKNGRVDFRQQYQDILDQRDLNHIVNHKKGLRMEIWSAKTGHLMYHGECNEKREKEGWGIEYDEESGKVVVEGMWNKGTMTEVIRCFNGNTMTELKRNGVDSLDPTKRIPIYVGGFRYDEDNEAFIREGKGCLIDEKTGIATRECEWKDGKEVSGIDLYVGWYNIYPVEQTITESKELESMSLELTDLIIASNCCNDVNALNLNRFEWLKTIEIGDDCFGSVQTFQIDKLNRLKTLKIGNKSFSIVKNNQKWDLDKVNNESKSFHILNCGSLESIQIGEYSFVDFAGDFELKNLPQLQSIQIGTIKSQSYNFNFTSFVVRGIDIV